MTDADVAGIVGKLSERQREAIKDAADMMSSHKGYPFFTVVHTGEPWPEGVAQFLTLRSDRLTRCGLAVRAHLLSSDKG
jgi:hypothetical protein